MQNSPSKRPTLTRVIAAVAIVFGALTLKEGGAVLFGDGTARTAAGHFVPFVVWFNFLAGFAYIVAGVGLWMQQRWAAWLAVGVAVAAAIAFAAFGMRVLGGGAYEMRTVWAMTLRTLLWAAIAALSWRLTSGRSGAMR